MYKANSIEMNIVTISEAYEKLEKARKKGAKDIKARKKRTSWHSYQKWLSKLKPADEGSAKLLEGIKNVSRKV